MLVRLLSSLSRLTLPIKRDQRQAPLVAVEAAPLDHVERLQRSGSTSRVVMELPRLGW
jgi:hypothetical protein